MSTRKNNKGGNLSVNRKALRDYSVIEKLETGIELVGTEVKVVREGQAGLAGAFAMVENNQLFLHNMTIPPYPFGNRFNHDSLRVRRLLAHKKEILRMRAMMEQKGLALIPLRMYLNSRGLVKVELAVCRGKAQEDKRETIRRRDNEREAQREIAHRSRH
jgi:SsrA-binding protein